MNEAVYRIECLSTLPRNLKALADNLADKLVPIYAEQGAAMYRQHAEMALGNYTQNPNLRFWSATRAEECVAMVLTQMPADRGEIAMVHVQAEDLPDNVECALVTNAIRDLQERGAQAILAEFFPTSPLRCHSAFQDLGFHSVAREMLSLPVLPERVHDFPACRELLPSDADAAGACLAAAYEGDPGSYLHEEMRSAASAADVAERALQGGFGAVMPGMNVAAWEGDECVAVALGCMLAPEIGFTVQLATHPQHRGKGYARAALFCQLDAFRAAGCRSASLAVTQSNTAACALYASLGYERIRSFDAWVWYREFSEEH